MDLGCGEPSFPSFVERRWLRLWRHTLSSHLVRVSYSTTLVPQTTTAQSTSLKDTVSDVSIDLSSSTKRSACQRCLIWTGGWRLSWQFTSVLCCHSREAVRLVPDSTKTGEPTEKGEFTWCLLVECHWLRSLPWFISLLLLQRRLCGFTCDSFGCVGVRHVHILVLVSLWCQISNP